MKHDFHGARNKLVPKLDRRIDDQDRMARESAIWPARLQSRPRKHLKQAGLVALLK